MILEKTVNLKEGTTLYEVDSCLVPHQKTISRREVGKRQYNVASEKTPDVCINCVNADASPQEYPCYFCRFCTYGKSSGREYLKQKEG